MQLSHLITRKLAMTFCFTICDGVNPEKDLTSLLK